VSNERVSVVIPCYNYAHFLPAAINSALRQTHHNIEVIVVDDGSVDDTAAVAARYGDRIRYIRQENQGLSAARNRGLQAAEGTLIQFLDADDVLGHTSVQERVAYLERYPDTSAVICRSCYFQDKTPPAGLAPLLGGVLSWK
jgi:glycosyltransferase involved in cell wall biosynthesis